MRAFYLVLSTAFFAACQSGSPTTVDCTMPFTACGGNVVGTWHWRAACGVPSTWQTACPNAMFAYHDSAGTFTFGSDGTLSETLGGNYSEIDTYPSSCLGNGNPTCDDLNMTLASVSDGGSCSPSSIGCTCTATDTGMQTAFSGSFTTSGTTLTIDTSATGSQMATYCVQGGVLELQAGGLITALAR